MSSKTKSEMRMPAEVLNPGARSPLALVCEHASNDIPDRFDGLGVSPDVRSSHVAWDPGALAVARRLSSVLDARLVVSSASRLLYDCNRAPDSPGAVPVRSERYDIPGNGHLSPAQRQQRIEEFYLPFRDLLAETLASPPAIKAMVTVHSFTPVYMGRHRDVEIGILHDSDRRFADAMLKCARAHTEMLVRRNEPYGPEDDVTHTLKAHGVANGLLNVMLEIRNDLIASTRKQRAVADMLAGWIADAMADLGVGLPHEVA